MIRKVHFLRTIAVVLLATAGLSASAAEPTGTEPNAPRDEKQVHGPRPDLPGKLIINIGSVWLQDAPGGMDLKVFGSRTFDLYYAQTFDIPKLKLSIVPGLGFGFDRFSFQKAVQLDYNAAGELILDSLENGAERSKFITNYIDLPLELRFIPFFDQKEKSVWIGIGGWVGYNFEAHSKLKFEEDDQIKMVKRREDWNLNPIRYGVHARLGVGGFSVFYKMGLSELFDTDKGPNGFAPTINSLGISFNGF